MSRASKRLTLAATASVAALGLYAGPASADPSDLGIIDPGFSLNANTLEPGCSLASALGAPSVSHLDVTQNAAEVHVRVLSGANFSVDQVLVPGSTVTGYRVYNTFDTGSNAFDVDIDPDQTATDLTGPGGANANSNGVIVCVSDHPDADQNEPYVQDGLPGEVAATNRPIVNPTIAALGVSAVGPLHTYKVGFGYGVQRRYDLTWRTKFGSGGDPMAGPAFGTVTINPRIKQAGVRRYNDIDQFSEAFGGTIADYGQPRVFDVTSTGDPFAYLHNSAGLLSFTTQGDLPISWSVKPSLAPESYGRSVTISDDMLRAWNKSWQDYYAGKGAKPALPLAPGTNSPDPDPSISVVVNPPEVRVSVAPQVIDRTTTVTKTTVVPAKAKATVAARLVKARNGGRVVQVFVNSLAKQEMVRIRLLAKGHVVTATAKRVSSNKFVKITGLKVAKKVTSVRAAVMG
jgi:hypothetical protein